MTQSLPSTPSASESGCLCRDYSATQAKLLRYGIDIYVKEHSLS